jgi:hypothetical protein
VLRREAHARVKAGENALTKDQLVADGFPERRHIQPPMNAEERG